MNIKDTSRKRGVEFWVVSLLMVFLVVPPAFAADNCIQDIWKAHNNNQNNNLNLICTANDVRIASVDSIRDLDGFPLKGCVSGETFSFLAVFHIVLRAQARYDIGLYFATDGDPNGDGALTGICDASIITPQSSDPPYEGSATFIQLDPAPDSCGDIDEAHNPQAVIVEVDNVLCTDVDGDGFLNLPNCTSWRIPGSNEECQTSFDAYPGSPSKCNCEEFTLPIFVEAAR